MGAKSLNNWLVRGWSTTLTTGSTAEVLLVEDASLRALVERDPHIGEIVRRASLYVDGTLADELEVLDEWFMRVAVQGKTVLVLPLGQCAQARPRLETNAALASSQTEWARSDATGAVPNIVIPSVEDAVSIFLFPGPQAAAPQPAANTVVAVMLHFEEFLSDQEVTR